MDERTLGPDVLASGADEPERPSLLSRPLLAVLALAALLTVPSDVPTPAPPPRDGGAALQLVLRVGAPRLLPPAALWRTGTEEALVVDVVNAGPRPVTITSATLAPGLWQVRVLDDRPVPPDARTSLALQRLADCRRGIDAGDVPEHLVLVATVDGRSLLHQVAVRDVPGPDRRPLAAALRSASVACGVRQGYDAG